MAQSAKEFLTNTSISSFLNSIEHVISIQANEKAVEALGKILENKISALPVRNADSHNFGSFIDTLDICTFIMQTIDACGDDLDKAEKLFLETTCSQVANRGEKNTFHQVLHTDNLKSCLAKMVALSNIHRLPVFDLRGNFVGILSQSTVVNVITENIRLFGMITNKSVNDLRLGIKKVISVNVSAPIKAAFKLIADCKISGVAITEDNSNILVGNVSSSDIKITGLYVNGKFVQGSFQKLNTPIKEILSETMIKKKPVVVHPNTSITEVFKTMSREKIHRTYVVKEKTNELIGVISLVDLLSLIIQYV